MHNGFDANRTAPPGPLADPRPYAMLGAGQVMSSLWKQGDPASGWAYRFNVFRMSRADGQVSQLLRPEDVHDLVQICRILAAELVHDGCLPHAQRRALANLAETLNELTDTWRP